MKVTFVVDHLLERNIATRCLEVLLPIFEEHQIDILTLAHLPGAVGNPLESHRITSSFLSKLARRIDLLQEKSFLIPGALQSLCQNHQSDLYIVISNGWSHLIEPHLNPQTPSILYIIEGQGHAYLPKSIFAKLLSFAFDKKRSKLNHLNAKLFFASHRHEQDFEQASLSIIPPVYDVDLFQFVRDEEFKFEFNWIVVFADYTTKVADLTKLQQLVAKTSQKLIVISSYPKAQKQLKHLKLDVRVMTREVFQHHVPTALFCVDLTAHEFPYFSLGALAMGRPVVADNALSFLGESYGVYPFTQAGTTEVINHAAELDRAKLRRLVLRLNGRIFKQQFLTFMKEHPPFSQFV
jgi:hypothetical protein